MYEVFDIVNRDDEVIGHAARSEVHGNPNLIHRVAHVLVFNSKGELYLQKRAEDKDVQPGKWDSSVGGHLARGETYQEAAFRETEEELGIVNPDLHFLSKYIHSNDYESEYVTTFSCVYDGPIIIQQSEIEEGRFWKLDEVQYADPKLFTPNFLQEMDLYVKWQRQNMRR